MIYRIINKIGKMSPDFINRLFIHIPFKFRYGKVYVDFKDKIKESEGWSEKELENYVIGNFDKIFQYSKKFKFYKEKYNKKNVLDLTIKSVEDIKKIPILTRDEIRDNIEEFKGAYCETTAGTSGNPLSIYLDKNAWIREYAHFHHIWRKVGYKHTDARFVLKRQNLKDKFIKYDFSQNEFVINTYKMTNKNIEEFFNVQNTYKIKYFHGYPSAISDFLKEIENKLTEKQKNIIKEQIVCCFFGSEYPVPHVIKYLKNEWNLDYISWYGHSEVCVLARTEKNKLNYYPLHTYGYVEVESKMLLGTSYHNFDMPLIRYNTDDLVTPDRYSNGILKSFKVEQGRIFDLVIDKNGLKETVNRLIRGASHKVFDFVDHVQVYQEKEGYVTFIISKKNETEDFDAKPLMNLEKFDIEFNFIYIKEPLRTPSGKVPLRVRNLPNNN